MKIIGRVFMIWGDQVKAYQGFSLARKGGLVLLGIYLAKSDWSLTDIGYWEALLFGVTLLGSFWLDAWLKVFLSEPASEKGLGYTFHWIVEKILLFSFFMALAWWIFQTPLQVVFLPFAPSSWTNVFVVFSFFWMPALALPAYFLVKKQAGPIWVLSLYYLLGLPAAFILADRYWAEKGMAIYGLIGWVLPLFAVTMSHYIREKRLSGDIEATQLWSKWRSLVLYALLAVAAPLFDAWLVQIWYPEPETFAIFRYGAREFPLVSTLAAALSTAMIPIISANGQSGLSEVKRRTRRLIWMLYPITIILMISSKYLFSLVFSEQFETSAGIFNIYLLLTISQLIMIHPLILAHGLEKWLVKAALIEFGSNIILSLILGYISGMEGIAVATVLAFLLEKILLVRWLRKKLNIRLSSYFPVDGFVAALILLLVWYGTTYIW